MHLRPRWRLWLLAAAALPVLAACGATPGTTNRPPPPAAVPLPAGVDTRVERVVDGDTIVVAGGHRVRLIGVDTPETKDPRRGVQCYGKEASAFLAGVLASGTSVRLVGDVEQHDAYDRTLAYVYRLPDGLFVNAELVRRGYADVLTIPPNVAHAAELAALAREARQGDRGLWAACAAAQPP